MHPELSYLVRQLAERVPERRVTVIVLEPVEPPPSEPGFPDYPDFNFDAYGSEG